MDFGSIRFIFNRLYAFSGTGQSGELEGIRFLSPCSSSFSNSPFVFEDEDDDDNDEDEIELGPTSALNLL
jgi:hypothetical protein